MTIADLSRQLERYDSLPWRDILVEMPDGSSIHAIRDESGKLKTVFFILKGRR